MSLGPSQDPTTAGYRETLATGTHAGVDTAPAHVDSAVDGRARTALTLGVLSIVFNILAGIPAIVVGAHSLRRIKADPTLKGRGIAWVGIALGSLSVLTFVTVVYLLNR